VGQQIIEQIVLTINHLQPTRLKRSFTKSFSTFYFPPFSMCFAMPIVRRGCVTKLKVRSRFLNWRAGMFLTSLSCGFLASCTADTRKCGDFHLLFQLITNSVYQLTNGTWKWIGEMKFDERKTK